LVVDHRSSRGASRPLCRAAAIGYRLMVSRRWIKRGLLCALMLPLLWSSPRRAEAAPERLELLCRAAWGARKATKPLTRHVIKRITVHHSGRALVNNRTAPRRLRGAQRFHQTGKRSWADIAYHYLIDRAGHVYEGRPSWARGDTATRYDTTGHLLVCVVGNYEKQRLNRRQFAALAKLLAWASREHKVDPKHITGHRQHARTSCPGTHLQQLITGGELRKRVARALRTGVELRQLCGNAGRDRVRTIEGRAKAPRSRRPK
jgi:hypothetical protein